MDNKNLISLENWSIQDINDIFNLAQQTPKKFNDKLCINLFFENSTRTRVSFEIAAKNLAMNVVNINSASSSVAKGETLLDTILTIKALKPDIIVVRHPHNGAPNFIAKHINCPLINAGDGAHAHPSQALLDAFTIKQVKKHINGLNIAICGDILHSRVARSNIICLSKLGANIRLIAPSTLLPSQINSMGLDIYHSLQDGLKNVDVIILLRLQKERMEHSFIPSIREYNHFYGLSSEKLKYAKDDCMVMHPGPINRDIELTSELTQHPRVYIEQQVNNGLAIRMAVIQKLLMERAYV